MIARHILSHLQEYLATFPVTWLGGTRQSGKSTLALSLEGFTYITLDDIALLTSAKESPQSFIRSLPKPVIIDEIQRAPELLLPIKQEVDEHRTNGRYILTGSANLLGMKQVSDSLAGRLGILQLFPLSMSEIYAHPADRIAALFDFKPPPSPMPGYTEMLPLMLQGGYPEIQKIPTPKLRKLWFDAYISTYIERDAFTIAQVRKKEAFYKLFHILSSRSATLLNKAALANDVGVSAGILDDYLGLLQTTYQIGLLPAFWENTTKRYTKMPKLFFQDSGVLCSLLGADESGFASLAHKGAIAETFIYSELLKAAQLSKLPISLYHWRTSDHKEIDFILASRDQLVCIEVKSATQLTKEAFKHINSFAQEHPERFAGGFVFYLGEHLLPFGDRLWGIPFGWWAA